MRRLLLVANPAASRFTSSLHRDVVATLRARYDLTPVWPNGPDDAQRAAAAAAADGFDCVTAMGGDGVVHRVANGLVGTDTALAVIPAGTSNVFARISGYPRSGRAAATAVADSASHRVAPTVLVEPVEGEARHAVFAAGVGFDADVIAESERKPLRKIGSGTIHYARSAVRVALSEYRRKPPDLRVTVGEDEIRAVTVITQVNDRFTFIGPRALSLGRQHALLAVRRATPLRLLGLAWRAASTRMENARGTRTWSPFQEARVDAAATVPLEVDGEWLGRVDGVRFTFRPGTLRVVEPQPA